MKKLFYIFAIFAAAFSCAQVPEGEVPATDANGLQRIQAELDDDDTKVLISSEDGVTFYHLWEKEDKISVYDGSTHVLYTLEGDGGTTGATFVGNATTATTLYAVYPYSDQNTYDSGYRRFGVTYPAVQKGIAGSYDPSANIMVGWGSRGKIKFVNASSYLQLSLTSDSRAKVSSIEVTAIDGTPIAGPATIMINNRTRLPETTMADEGTSSTITLKFDEPLVLGYVPTVVYLALPPVEIASGLSFTLRGEKSYLGKVSSSARLVRNNVLKMPELAFVPVKYTGIIEGQPFNAAVKTLAAGGGSATHSTQNTTVKKIVFNGGANLSSLTGVDVSAEKDGSVILTWDAANGIITVNTSADEINLPADMSHFFSNFRALEAIENIGMLNGREVVNLNSGFYQCMALKSIELGWLEGAFLTGARSLFNGCSAITEIDLSEVNLNFVEDMTYLFYNCTKLESINVRGFTPNRATSAYAMFANTSSLKKIPFQNLHFENAKNLTRMFEGSGVTEVNLDGFYAPKATRIDSMFRNCTAMTSFNFGKTFSTVNATSAVSFLNGCSNLASADLTGINTTAVTSLARFFYGCSKLEDLVIPDGMISPAVKSLVAFMSGCSSIKKLDLSGQTPTGITNFSSTFSGCTSLSELNLRGWNTESATTMYGMFYNCGTADLVLDLFDFNTEKVTDMGYMFQYCKAKSINVGMFSTEKVKYMNYMFANAENITSLNLGSFWPCVTFTMRNMFANCKKLQEIKFSGAFRTSEVDSMQYMFSGCESLKELDLSTFDNGNVKVMSNFLDGAKSLSKLKLDGFGTGNVTDFSYMFRNCYALTELDLSSFETSKAKNMAYMFRSCGVTELNLDHFDLTNVTHMNGLVRGCESLKKLSLKGDKCSSSALTALSYFFDDAPGVKKAYFGKNFKAQHLTNTNVPTQFFPAIETLSDSDPMCIYCTAALAQKMIKLFPNCVDGVNQGKIVFYSHYDNNVPLKLSQPAGSVTTACVVTDEAEPQEPKAGTGGTGVDNYNPDNNWSRS